MAHLQVPIAFEGLYRPNRYKIRWGGRGGAKSWQFADALLIQGDIRPLKILCCREIQKSIKESVHSLLERRIKEHGLTGYTVANTEIKHVNGTHFIFEGLWQNIDSIKSIDSVDICWIEEANTVSEESWKKLIPSIRKEGSEIWASFNPELKSDPVYQRFVINPPDSADVLKVSWRDNPWFTGVMKDEMEHLKETDYDEYLHVWEGELKQFADGAIYGKQLQLAQKEKRILSIPVDPIAEVHTFWDLGRNDQTAIWFMQRIGAESRFIDYYESRLVGLDHYIQKLKELGYNYGKHYLPHDVEVKELSSNRSRREMLEESGLKPIEVVPRIHNVNEGIEQTRRAFSGCYFHKGSDERGLRMEMGMDALANYQYVFDEKHDTFRQSPLHNWASNAADAFRQFGQGYRHVVIDKPHVSDRRAKAIRNNKHGKSWIV
ncbi:MAG: PBSX family phage terminase large subunit [Gammaproteobacteria bacterium]|nr:MAG: PBSX family phage terminase large subunit [Gammaproteobacteria bacterium]